MNPSPMSVVLSWLLLAVISSSVAVANSTPVTRGSVQGGTVVPVATSDVAVVREKLDVEIAPTAEWNVVPVVTVSAEYVLRHEGTEPIELEVGFPVAGQFMNVTNIFGEPPPVPGLGYEVTLNSAPLDATEEALPLPPTARTGGWYENPFPLRDPDALKAENERLTLAFTRWVSADPELEAMLQEYSRIAPSWEEHRRRNEAFEEAVTAAFGASHWGHTVSRFLRDHSDRYSVAELIRVIDPSIEWRSPETYDDATLDSFRRTIDERLGEHPEIAQLHAPLAEQTEIQRLARQFINERVQPHLAARYELSDVALRRLVRYLESAYNPNRHGYIPAADWERARGPVRFDPPAETLPKDPPGVWLVAQIDPDIEALRLARIAETDALLDRYGFDATFLSPLTARGYSKRVGWRDDSTWDILGFEPPTDTDPEWGGRFVTNDRITHITSPRSEARLILFTVPMHPGQVRTLRVKYSALVEADELNSRWYQHGSIYHFRYILTTARNWKSFGPIDLTVTLSDRPMVVIDPPPQAQCELGDGRIQYSARIVNPDRNLRVALGGHSGLSKLAGPADLDDLRTLRQTVEHPQARHVVDALLIAAERMQEK